MKFDPNIELQHSFEGLNADNYDLTSPRTPSYNCIAWAAEDMTRFWWPHPTDIYYWPDEAPMELTLAAFISAYETLGYSVCANGEFEKATIKIAIYTNPLSGVPTHAARQLRNGKWTSKLGNYEDIRHDNPEVLQGRSYGIVSQYMKKRR